MVNRTIERHPDADHLLDDMITWPDNPETAWYYEQIQEATNSHEYTMNTDDEQNPYEIWTELLPNRDWSELEKAWSDANDGAGSGKWCNPVSLQTNHLVLKTQRGGARWPRLFALERTSPKKGKVSESIRIYSQLSILERQCVNIFVKKCPDRYYIVW